MEKQRQRCEEMKVKACSTAPLVKFMLQHLEQLGCEVTAKHMVCIPCDDTTQPGGMAGGFDPETGIKLCQDRLPTQDLVDQALAHDLVHMYDHCRAMVDWTDARHQACTEIRAATLSGECGLKTEFMRTGKFKIKDGMRGCVRRRAILSVQANAHVTNHQAAQAVDDVFTRCYADCAPFAMHP